MCAIISVHRLCFPAIGRNAIWHNAYNRRRLSSARSLGLNLFEYVSDSLGSCRAALNHPPKIHVMLIAFYKKAVFSVSIDRIIDSITHSCMYCITSCVIILHIKCIFPIKTDIF